MQRSAMYFFEKNFESKYQAQILAIKAVLAGVANENQQKMLLPFLIKVICRTDEINYMGTDNETNFALGREAVGKVMRGLALNQKLPDGTNQQYFKG